MLPSKHHITSKIFMILVLFILIQVKAMGQNSYNGNNYDPLGNSSKSTNSTADSVGYRSTGTNKNSFHQSAQTTDSRSGNASVRKAPSKEEVFAQARAMIMNNPNIPADLKAQILEKLRYVLENYHGNPQELISQMQFSDPTFKLNTTNQEGYNKEQPKVFIASGAENQPVPSADTVANGYRNMVPANDLLYDPTRSNSGQNVFSNGSGSTEMIQYIDYAVDKPK